MAQATRLSCSATGRTPPQKKLNHMRIYIESTIPSYVVARPARDLIQAAHQQLTRDWWDLQREQHEPFTSQLVLDESARGELEMAQRRLALLADIPLLESTEEARSL